MSDSPSKSNYHHGDLRQKLLEAATETIKSQGIEALSLRKLATEVGVSRMAPYHHFKDKNELLCAIAEQGFQQRKNTVVDQSQITNEEDNQLLSYMLNYVRFAQKNPEIYELMFGRTIWKNQIDNDSLKNAAYPTFQYQLDLTKQWQANGLLDANANSLRLSQVIWGTMHGIAKLLIDGIYTDTSQIEAICMCAVEQFAIKLEQ